MVIRAERFTDVVTHHGEGVGWDGAAGVLRCVDMLAGDVVTLDDSGQVTRRDDVGEVAAAWRPRTDGGLVVGTQRGFALLDVDGGPEWSTEAWSDPAIRMNEGACDPDGRFWCGSMAYAAGPGAGTLWRLDADRSVHRVLDGFSIANGLVWSQDGTAAYHVDSPTGRVDVWAYVDGGLTDRRRFADVAGGDPDGIALDAEGGVWVAVWNGGVVHRYAADGALDVVVEIGARQVTACGFGGPDLDRLYVTTSREGLAPDDDPAAGSLFVLDPGVRGVALRPFAG